MPDSGTRRASMPSWLPIQWMSTGRTAGRLLATARTADVCRPVPPPAITIRTRMGAARRESVGSASPLGALEGERDEPGDQLAVRDARGLPELGVGGGGGETRDGVDLVHEHAVVAVDE